VCRWGIVSSRLQRKKIFKGGVMMEESASDSGRVVWESLAQEVKTKFK